MGDVIELHGQPTHLEENQEFVADLCRFAENILSEAAVKKKYRFDDEVWEKLGENDTLVEKIEVAHGWIAPLPPTRRYDERRWRIVRGGQQE